MKILSVSAFAPAVRMVCVLAGNGQPEPVVLPVIGIEACLVEYEGGTVSMLYRPLVWFEGGVCNTSELRHDAGYHIEVVLCPWPAGYDRMCLAAEKERVAKMAFQTKEGKELK
jgi:hypothetical protein